jgi:hypothetical protein
MTILSARKYPSPRNGPLTPAQIETRRLAYAIKTTAAAMADFELAATEMAAALLAHNVGLDPIWLIPIPDSRGNTDANTRLAHLIARRMIAVGGLAQVAKAIIRTRPVQSQCTRHKLALGPISPDQHHFTRARKPLSLRQAWFVDNVTTSGNTLQAARDALGFGAGLVFADAAPRRVQLQATLL